MTTQVTLRRLTLSDAPQLQVISETALGYPFSLEETEKQLERCLANDSHFLIGAVDETDQVIGYVQAQIYEAIYSERGLNVLGLAVSLAHQGQGIGRLLMEELERQALEADLAFIRLNSGSHRLEAHAFYRKIGYNGDKTQVRFIKKLK
ncbi:GNAT family N-acetyltransferase [Streptococcus sp. S784/96/1]|uniref:GNAT family N-acetyltransferase n=1 Tax=Streptococcus sp. S784/96/1 TaxID=2653499 RepID=UPI001389E15E|nr:GNAT family N-acetyltransferase [Streptococcus sp. S784/96/1]